MKRIILAALVGVLVSGSVAVGSPSVALAKEIVMICTLPKDGETLTRYLKYSDPIIGPKKIYNRIDGKWMDWCRPQPGQHVPCELTITDRGAILKQVLKNAVDENIHEFDLQKGDPILLHQKYILDFEFATRRVEFYLTHINGRPFSKYTSEKPQIDVWNCKLKGSTSKKR